MAIGQGALVGNLSYFAVGREITYGTYATCTAGINFLSASIKTMKEVKIICDNCGQHITYTGSMPKYRIHLHSEEFPHNTNTS